MFEVAKKSDGIAESMQSTGLDLACGNNIFDNPKELFYGDYFSYFETAIDEIPSIVVVRTQMIPNDPLISAETEELKPQILEYLDSEILKGNKNYDVYLIGVKLHQTRVPEEEQNIYKIGGKYSGVKSAIQLIRKCESLNYGYSIDNPYKMTDVSDEYYFLEHLVSNYGQILTYDRAGSVKNKNNGILDLWMILVI